MSLTPHGQDSESLPYELLLRKSCKADLSATEPSADDASTVEPTSSSASSAGSAAVVAVAAPRKDSVTLLRNVVVHGPSVDKALAPMLAQTRELSQKVFDEDCLQDITKKSGWKLSLLVSKDLSVLCGFIVSKVTKGALSIAKIAVPAEFRGHGLGRLIMDEMMKSVKKQGDVYEVCLSSLPTAVTFYQRLGFKAFKGVKIAQEDGVEFVEGQVYMEKRLQKRRR